ncbi:peroxide stress protein YaaA [Aestuariibius sp. HNIBRBA575]|uniref:peroxide stress protein YaaA n=1 Tax=Aestuariibius sp. HNIBRBA575 TaxID=3233343 RepID=UPI0034A4ACF3
MLVVISPAKALNLDPVDVSHTDAAMQIDANRLAKTMRNQSLTKLKALMSLSDSLARLNRDRFQDYQTEPGPDVLHPAAFAFDGDTYRGLETRTLSPDDLRWAQDHLRILSGLYGVLRPLDGIQAYRLEMGSRLKTRRGSNLYDYWGDQIAKSLVADAKASNTDVIVNCASEEYFKAANTPALKLRLVQPVFMEEKAGTPKIVSFFAKQARGAMARFIVQNRVTDIDTLRSFASGGYQFDPELSEGDRLVFVRPYPDPA